MIRRGKEQEASPSCTLPNIVIIEIIQENLEAEMRRLGGHGQRHALLSIIWTKSRCLVGNEAIPLTRATIRTETLGEPAARRSEAQHVKVNRRIAYLECCDLK
ncbi:hypothetical protein E2C01_043799 [Portunus trituberculatus]|uniref:Uncharacterized protein n=1 Tax=Portunus trituberculatus TaxID=210409 RepID=A0A5B7FR78_PORTR|nr:hypothetical protein [Portunus trituberculatus]